MAESMPLAAMSAPFQFMSAPFQFMSAPFQFLVRHAARERERITIVDQDEPAAIVISAEELEDLEDALAVAQSRLREAAGETDWISHEDVRHRLGFDR